MVKLLGFRGGALGVALVAALWGCGSEERSSAVAPEHAFEAWVEVMRHGEDALLRAYLPEEMVASLVASAEAWERIHGEERPLRAFLEPVWLPRPADVDRKERLPSDEEGRLTLRVHTYAGAALDVPMVREPQGWVVRPLQEGASAVVRCTATDSSTDEEVQR